GDGPAGDGPAGDGAPGPGAATPEPVAAGGDGAWPEAKSWPHTSQNCPDLAVPHCGQGSAGVPGAARPGPASAGGAGAAEAEAEAEAEAAGPAAAPMRIPHTSQKSGSVLSCPAGQVGMP